MYIQIYVTHVPFSTRGGRFKIGSQILPHPPPLLPREPQNQSLIPPPPNPLQICSKKDLVFYTCTKSTYSCNKKLKLSASYCGRALPKCKTNHCPISEECRTTFSANLFSKSPKSTGSCFNSHMRRAYTSYH